MNWLTPELPDTVMEHWGKLSLGGGAIVWLLTWYIGCKYGLPWRKKS